jgi:hypothetical protein
MNHKIRAMLFTLAVCLFVAPMAFAANFVGGADVQVPPLTSTSVPVDIDNDIALRGVGFGYELVPVTAAAATVDVVTVGLVELTSRRVTTGNSGVVFLAGRNGADDLAIGTYPAAVTIDVTVDGLTGDYALLIIGGVDPWPGNPIFVDTDPGAARTLLDPDTIVVEVKAGVVVNLVSCPTFGETYEGGAVAIEATTDVNDGVFASLDLISVTKDGTPTVPTNAPVVTGLGLVEAPDAEGLIMFWASAPGDAGVWEFCFEAANDLGDTDAKCVTVTVGVPDADHVGFAAEMIEYTDGAGPFAYAMTMSTTHSYDSTFGIVLPTMWTQAAGAAYLSQALLEGDVVYPPGYSVFESQSTNVSKFLATPPAPDSLLFGLIDFGGAALNPGTYDITINTMMLDQEGIIAIDTLKFPPANELSFNVPDGGVVTPTYSPGCYPVTIIRNIAPDEVTCPVSLVPGVVFGDLVTIPGFTYNDPDDSPGPWIFHVTSMAKDGTPATPVNTPTFTGDTFNWQTAADENDVGLWEFCVTVNDGVDDGPVCCFEVEVISEAPFFFCIGTNEAFSNSDVTVCITGLNEAPVPLAGGFDLLLDYDGSLLTLKDVQPGQALIDEEWEYFTWRIVSTNPAKIRIVAIADMNNSNVHPTGDNPLGDIACLTFHTTNDRTLACQKAYIRFEWRDCGDNTVASATGDTLFIVGGVDAPVIYDDMSGNDFYMDVPDIYGWNATVTEGCVGTQKQEIIPFIRFCNGWIKIKCPGDIDDRGDLNLNGFAYEIADAVLYTNYFIVGTSAFDPTYYEAQIAASDINNDGVPLTVADLVYMIRVITGDAQPIEEDMLGNGPKVAAAGTLDVIAAKQGSNLTIKASSYQDLGAGLFVFKYENTDISAVTLQGRASEMDVTYQAENGELRVLVYNIEDRAKVAAGTGEILSIATTGVGTVELVSVEAATFMGGSLEANVTAKVIPTAYALHQNYPNPFNPSTSMAIDFPNAGDYTLTVYNIAGQTVKTFSGSTEAGTLTITWDGNDNRGSKVASGVYFYRVEADAFHAVKKMVLMK